MSDQTFSWLVTVTLSATMAFGTLALPVQAEELAPLREAAPEVPEQKPVEEGLIELSNGVKLYAWDTGGEGEVVVFAHPASGNHQSWYYQQPVFAEAGYRVIGYSARSFYGSDAGPEDDKGTLGNDLAQLLDAFGVDKAHVVGVAAGGSTALDFALSFPERTHSAGVAASLMSISEDDYREAMLSARGEWFDALPPEAKELSASYRVLYPDGVEKWLGVYALNDFKNRPRTRQPTEAKINWDTLAANEVPLLLMTGGADIYMPPSLLRRTAQRIANAEVHVIPEAGHPIFIEAPEVFNKVVLDFMQRNSNGKMAVAR